MLNRLFLSCFFLAMTAFAGTQNGKFTVAFWGDCRDNGGNAEVNICGHILKNKGAIYDATWNDGDFTPGGTAAAWSTSLGRTNVSAVATVKDFYFMCNGNHDANGNDAVYQSTMGSILPSNGANCYYYHKAWSLPNSSRKLHLCVSAYELNVTTAAEQAYFNTALADAGPNDWIVDLVHPPAWKDMTYKGDDPVGIAMEAYFRGKGGDLVLNGHAHVYCRTHVLSVNSSGRPVIVDTCKGSYRKTPDNIVGMIHIVNGRGGQFDANTNSGWAGHAFAPNLNDQVGLVTKLEFDDNKVTITTIGVGGAPNYDQVSVIEGPFTWERGPASSTPAAPRVACNAPTLMITHVRNAILITTGSPGKAAIFNVYGKLVRNITIGPEGTGKWTGMDMNGNRVVNGSYIVKANCGNTFVQTQITFTR
jgi:hypothetical protein